jgi:hypothetical protein
MKQKLALCLVLALPLLLGLAPPKKTKAGHPQVEEGETCDSCHREITPEVVEAWFRSRHGLNNVKCFVCHGSTGQDFMRRAPISRCVGCHGDKVEAMSKPFFAGKDCFACHSGHELNPHLSGGGQ